MGRRKVGGGANPHPSEAHMKPYGRRELFKGNTYASGIFAEPSPYFPSIIHEVFLFVIKFS
jgi:hypothetical protein